MRRAFTLIELLTIVAIIGIMVTAAVVNVRQGQGAVRLKAATRDIFATIRHARSMALASREPSIITYSTGMDGDEPCAKIDIVTAKIFSGSGVVEAETLSGEKIRIGEDPVAGESGGRTPASASGGEDEASVPAEEAGESIDEILFAPISAEVVRGIRVKVIREGDEVDGYEVERTKPKISVFSNVDFLLGRYKEAKSEAAKAAAASGESAESGAKAADTAEDSEVSIVWEVNGRVEPHKVWIYEDGKRYDEGMCISVDKFGAAKVLEEEE